MSSKEVTALQDLIAGGVAGSISVVVGHPFDTYKVRLQTSSTLSQLSVSGSLSSLFRGIGPPLSTAAIVNALIFSSYGESSRWWDAYFYPDGEIHTKNHSSQFKSFVCGSFAGAIQALVICPSEHVKCRLQIKQNHNPSAVKYKSSLDAMDKILSSHGLKGLYRGFVCTAWR